MEKLVQENGFCFKAFVLREDDIHVQSRDFEEELEYSLDYTDLGLRTYRQSARKYRALQGLIFLAMGMVVITFLAAPNPTQLVHPSVSWGVLAIGELGLAFIRLHQEPALIYLTGGQKQISFLADHPSEEELDSFVKELMKRIKDAYRETYLSKEDKLSDKEHRERIHWLREMKVITRPERDFLLAEVANGEPIGFRRTA
jgi:hypothetical protein